MSISLTPPSTRLSSDSCAVLSLRMICSAVCLVRFMVESPAQLDRVRTLIHPGLTSGVHIKPFSVM